MELKRSKTVFIEYSSSEKGQHFMTVVQNVDHKRIIIGRIFRDYDNNNKKMQYRAVDWAGNQVFVDTKDISALKAKFIENGKTMAMTIPKSPTRHVQNGRVPSPDKPYRLHELKKIREPKTEKKIKGQKLEKTEKQEIGKEKQIPELNDRDKDLQQIRQPNTETKPEIEKEQQVNDTSEKSERDQELEEIRDRNDENDREQEQEVEIDM